MKPILDVKPILLSLLLFCASGPAFAFDCGRLTLPRFSYKLTTNMTFEGRVTPLSAEISRSDVTIVRLRAADGSLDMLNEMRGFAPTRTINGLTGETLTFSLRPISGSIGGFEPGEETIYEQNMVSRGKIVRSEMVTQKVTPGEPRKISGCEVATLRIARVFEDQDAKTRRSQEFIYAPALSYPLWSRIEVLTANGLREQIIEAIALAEDEPAPAPSAAPPAPAPSRTPPPRR